MSGQVKAFMSDAYSRLAHVCAVQPPHAAPVSIDEWLENDKALGAATALEAEREARMILKIAQPTQPDYRHLGSGIWSLFEVGEQYPNTSPVADFGSALAEALEAFVR